MTEVAMNFSKKVWLAWEGFWFQPVSLYQVGLMRVIFGITLIWMYVLRFLQFETFYTEGGILPLDKFRILLPEAYHSPFTFFFTDDVFGWYAHLLLLLLLILFALGILGRLGTLFIFLLHLGFLQRNYAIIYGADLFATFWLLYLSLVKHNSFFSVLNLFSLRTRSVPELGSPLSTIGIRLIQIQLCLSYAYTGIEKLKGDQWWEGTAVWYVLGMREFMVGDFSYLQNFPLVIGLLTIITVLFEVYFPAAMVIRPLRPVWLILGAFFHISTGIFMNLPFFCAVMLAPYLLFLQPNTVKSLFRKVKTS